MLFFKRKKSIRLRITLAICLASFVVMVIGIALAYLWGLNFIRDTVRQEQSNIAGILAESVFMMIEDKAEDIENYASDNLWKEALQRSNLNTDESRAGELDSRVSSELRELSVQDKDIVEIFITDRKGILSAASSEPRNFYYQEEGWWQKAFSGGEGSVFIGNAGFDEDRKLWVLVFAVPIKDGGDVAGICRAVVDIKTFFEPLTNFKIEDSGHAVLVDGEGNIVFHEGVEPFSSKLCEYEEFKKLLAGSKQWMTVYSPTLHQKEIFFSFADIKQSIFSEKDMLWKVFVEQDAEEVFAPLRVFFIHLSFLTVLLIAILIPLGFILGGFFVRPIRKLHQAIKPIAEGNLDYNIEIKTGDEIEEFANSFNGMISNIKSKQNEIIKEAEERRRAEEELRLAYKRLQETQSQLIEAEKMEMIGRLASGVAHEVKNPLATILQGAEYLEGEIKTAASGELLPAIEYIKTAVKKADRVIRGLLDFSRLSELNTEPADLNIIIDKSVSLLKHTFNKKHICLIKDFQDGLPKLMIDKNRVEQIFVNLFMNSAQAIEGEGKIIVRTRLARMGAQGGGFWIGKDNFRPGETLAAAEVEDNGKGIPKDILGRIFDPFFTTEQGKGGTGLGLAIVKNIIEMQQGALEIKNRDEGGVKVSVMFKI